MTSSFNYRDSLCLEVKTHEMLQLISNAMHCQHITPVYQKSLVEVQGHGLELQNFSGLGQSISDISSCVAAACLNTASIKKKGNVFNMIRKMGKT